MDQDQTHTLQQKLGQGGSALAKYRRSVVGKSGYLHLFVYEIFSLFCLPFPGKVGITLRKVFMPFIFGNVGHNVILGKNCIIRNGKKIFIGDNCHINEKVTLDVKPGDKKLILGRNVKIGTKTIFNCSGGIIQIDDEAEIGPFCRIGSLQGIRIGRGSRLGPHSCISGAGHAFDKLDKPIIEQPLTCRGLTVLGDFVTIGERVTILNGVTIGDNVTIHSDSLVTKDIPDGQIVSGVPAREVV